MHKTSRIIDKQTIRQFHVCTSSYAKKLHWAKEARGKTHVDRALEHFDDLYESVYKNRWPSLRLGLLCEPKYMAIPNAFTGNVDGITKTLEGLGALDVKNIWSTYYDRMHKDTEQNSMQDLERSFKLEETLTKIAKTKKAEELEVLYQNAPWVKKTVETEFGDATTKDSRLIRDIREASQEFITDTRLKGADDFVFESDYYASYADHVPDKAGRHGVYNYTTRENFTKLKFPKFLNPYAFESGNPSSFPSANRESTTGLREYICINGASITPLIALDLNVGVTLLDLCSGPGTKSLLALMTNCPLTLVCNDLDTSRLARVKRILSEFTGTSEPASVQYTRYNAMNYPDVLFDRILLDAPCSQDRVSCTVADNNLFKPTRTKERLRLVDVQKTSLKGSFSLLTRKTGSCVVYSTCTLSPIENDGVVGAALRETSVQNLLVDQIGLWNALKPFQQGGIFHMSRTKFGVIIEPNVASNYGPMYVCRIVLDLPSSEKNSSNENDSEISNVT